MSSVRVIKKYANRRLYDTERSCYITQDTVKELVTTGIKFKILNAKSGEDVTRSVLLHIILDEEVLGVPLFTEEALRSIIMFSGSGLRSSFSGFLEQILPMLRRFQLQPGDKDAASQPGDRINDQYAALQGMLLGNAFQEYMNRGIDMMLKANRSMAASAAEVMTPGQSRQNKGKKG